MSSSELLVMIVTEYCRLVALKRDTTGTHSGRLRCQVTALGSNDLDNPDPEL